MRHRYSALVLTFSLGLSACGSQGLDDDVDRRPEGLAACETIDDGGGGCGGGATSSSGTGGATCSPAICDTCASPPDDGSGNQGGGPSSSSSSVSTGSTGGWGGAGASGSGGYGGYGGYGGSGGYGPSSSSSSSSSSSGGYGGYSGYGLDLEGPRTSLEPPPAEDVYVPLDKKATQYCDLPAGCTTVRGGNNGKWLQCFRDNQGGFGNCVGYCTSSGSCDLSSELQNQIVANCKDKATTEEKLTCLSNLVRAGLKGTGNVCRHHASCMDVLGGKLGVGAGWKNGGSSSLGRHAWNEYPIDGGTLIVDSYNDIIIRCTQ
ncbi:MAG: hypothetical protein WKG00_40210 [Polyangiaceae bacterium]